MTRKKRRNSALITTTVYAPQPLGNNASKASTAGPGSVVPNLPLETAPTSVVVRRGSSSGSGMALSKIIVDNSNVEPPGPRTAPEPQKKEPPPERKEGMGEVMDDPLNDMINEMANGAFDGNVDLDNFGSFDFDDDFMGEETEGGRGLGSTVPQSRKQVNTAASFAAIAAMSGRAAHAKRGAVKGQTKKIGGEGRGRIGPTGGASGTGRKTKGSGPGTTKGGRRTKKTVVDAITANKNTTKKRGATAMDINGLERSTNKKPKK